MYSALEGNQILQIQEEHVSLERIAFPYIYSLTTDFPYHFIFLNLDIHNDNRFHW